MTINYKTEELSKVNLGCSKQIEILEPVYITNKEIMQAKKGIWIRGLNTCIAVIFKRSTVLPEISDWKTVSIIGAHLVTIECFLESGDLSGIGKEYIQEIKKLLEKNEFTDENSWGQFIYQEGAVQVNQLGIHKKTNILKIWVPSHRKPF